MKIDLPPEGINLVICGLDAMVQAAAIVRKSVLDQIAAAQVVENMEKNTRPPVGNPRKR